MFFIAAIVGAIVTALLVNLLKKDVKPVEVGSPMTESEELRTEEGNVQKSPEETDNEINKLTDITNLDLIDINLAGTTRDQVIDEMLIKLDRAGFLLSKEGFREAIIKREQEGTTGIGMNIAIPHGKSDAVKKPSVVFGIKRDGVDWNSLDGTDAKLIFMIAVPKTSGGNEHLKILQILSRKLMDESFRKALLDVKTKEEAYTLLRKSNRGKRGG